MINNKLLRNFSIDLEIFSESDSNYNGSLILLKKFTDEYIINNITLGEWNLGEDGNFSVCITAKSVFTKDFTDIKIFNILHASMTEDEIEEFFSNNLQTSYTNISKNLHSIKIDLKLFALMVIFFLI